MKWELVLSVRFGSALSSTAFCFSFNRQVGSYSEDRCSEFRHRRRRSKTQANYHRHTWVLWQSQWRRQVRNISTRSTPWLPYKSTSISQVFVQVILVTSFWSFLWRWYRHFVIEAWMSSWFLKITKIYFGGKPWKWCWYDELLMHKIFSPFFH